MVISRLNRVVRRAGPTVTGSPPADWSPFCRASRSISPTKEKGTNCTSCPLRAIASCAVGKGRITRQYTHSRYNRKELATISRRTCTDPYRHRL